MIYPGDRTQRQVRLPGRSFAWFSFFLVRESQSIFRKEPDCRDGGRVFVHQKVRGVNLEEGR